MRAFRITRPRTGEVQELARPEPGPGDVLVRVRACSICGSDVHIWQGEHPRVKLPTVVGHEIAGEVAALGAGVEGLAVGQRAAVDGVIPCGRCVWCARGKGNVCVDYRFTGFRNDGALAEYTVVPAANIHPIPDTMPFELAAIVQPLAIAYHAVLERGAVEPGHAILIQGAGPIGLYSLALCKASGARVIVSDMVPARLAMARELGADEVVDARQADVAAAAVAFGDGLGVDRVIECVGGNQDETLKIACCAARPNGVVTLVGSHSQNRVTLPVVDFRWKELTLVASHSYPGTYPRALATLLRDRLPLERTISHVLPLERSQEAFELIDRGAPDVVKIVLTP